MSRAERPPVESAARSWWRSFALAIVLLAGAGLLVRSWWDVNSIDPGIQGLSGVLVLELSSPAGLQRSRSTGRAVPARPRNRFRRIPGVENAGISRRSVHW